nr:syncytin-A-like isoform X2 [Equus asinus]XP_044611140.1 syncytin-A-like isoform X2 [Equus asinus]
MLPSYVPPKQQDPKETSDSFGDNKKHRCATCKPLSSPSCSLSLRAVAEQGGVCAVANTICCTWINTSGEVETQLHKITEQATWLMKVTASVRSFFELFDFDWFGSWGPWLQSVLQTLGIILLIMIIVISLMCCILSKGLNACLQPLTTRKMISLRLEHQKRNKENDQPKRM